MSDHESGHRFFWGVVIVALGLLLLLDNLGTLDFGVFIARFWPLILIALGIKMIFFRRVKTSSVAGDIDSTEDANQVQFNHTFGDVRLKLNSKEFSGGEISNVFGNIEVDLEEVEIAQGEHRLNLKGVFGDLMIILPKKAPLSVKGSTSFGSARIKDRSSSGVSGKLEFATEDFEKSGARLVIQAHQVFGDLRIF